MQFFIRFLQLTIFFLIFTTNLAQEQISFINRLAFPNISQYKEGIASSNFLSLKSNSNLKKNNEKQFFSYSFNAVISGEASNKSGDVKQKTTYAYTLLNPSISLYSIPFGANIFLASNNTATRQTVNSFMFYYDVNAAKTAASEKAEEKLGEESPIVKFFSYFNSLEIGRANPNFSILSAQNVAINGISFEFNPGIFYLALALSLSQKPIDNLFFKRTIYVGRIGLGRKENFRFIISLLKGKDDGNSIRIDTSNRTLKPQENLVGSLDAKLVFGENRFSIEGELAGSFVNYDNREPEINREEFSSFLRKVVKPTLSSSFDYAYLSRVYYSNSTETSKFEGRVRMIGPGFKTFGNPSLSSDKFDIYGIFSQKFLNRQISTNLSAKFSRDNLANTKISTTKNFMPSFGLGLRFKNYPSVNFNYAQNFLWNETADLNRKINIKSDIFSAAVGYPYKFTSFILNTNFIYSFNKLTSKNSSNNFFMQNFNLTENLVFRFPLTISFNTGLLLTNYSNNQNSQSYSFDFGVGYVFFENWNNTLGVNYSTEKNSNDRIGFYFNSTYNIEKNIDIDFRLERNRFTEKAFGFGSYSELLVRSNIRIKFN